MRFETDKTIEYGLRLIEEMIGATIKSKWGKGFRSRSAPKWTHRTVIKETRHHGLIAVRVKGLFQATRWKRAVDFDCDMTAKIELKNGDEMFYEVQGGISPRNA